MNQYASNHIRFKLLAATLLCFPAITACNINGVPTGHIVSGTIQNAPVGKGTIKIAVIGANKYGIDSTNASQIVVTPQKDGVYTVSLSSIQSLGVYDVVAYADTNNNNRYDLGEHRSRMTTRYFVYSEGSPIDGLFNLKKGWNKINLFTVEQSGTPFLNYTVRF